MPVPGVEHILLVHFADRRLDRLLDKRADDLQRGVRVGENVVEGQQFIIPEVEGEGRHAGIAVRAAGELVDDELKREDVVRVAGNRVGDVFFVGTGRGAEIGGDGLQELVLRRLDEGINRGGDERILVRQIERIGDVHFSVDGEHTIAVAAEPAAFLQTGIGNALR